MSKATYRYLYRRIYCAKTSFLSEPLDLTTLSSQLTWRTVPEQLASYPRSVIIHSCIIGHKHYPQTSLFRSAWLTRTLGTGQKNQGLTKRLIIAGMGEFITWDISQWTLRSYEVVFSTYLEDCSSTACKLPQIRHNPCLHHRTQKPPSSFRAVNKTLQEYTLVYHIVFQAALDHWSYSELPHNHTSKQRHHNVQDYSLVLWAQHGILVSL